MKWGTGHHFPPLAMNLSASLYTRASRLLHKCHENVTICVLKLVVADYYLASINVATVGSLVNIRLLPFQHQIFYTTVSYKPNASIDKPIKVRYPC